MNTGEELAQTSKFLAYCLGRGLDEKETGILEGLFEKWGNALERDASTDKTFHEFCITYCLTAKNLGLEVPEFLAPFVGKGTMGAPPVGSMDSLPTDKNVYRTPTDVDVHRTLIESLTQSIRRNNERESVRPSRSLDEPAKPLVAHDYYRLVVGAHEKRLVWEARNNGERAWTAQSLKHIKILLNAYENGNLVFGEMSGSKRLFEMIFVTSAVYTKDNYNRYIRRKFDISNVVWENSYATMLVMRLLADDKTRHYVVANGGLPISWPPEKLEWKVRPSSDGANAEFYFVLPDGGEFTEKTYQNSVQLDSQIIITGGGITYEVPERL